MRTQRERAEEQRRLKLADVEEQVRAGSLTIRQMTPEERAKYPQPEVQRPRRTRR